MGRTTKVRLLFAKARAEERRLYDYMRQHHDDLAAEFGEGRILWRTPLKVFANLKLVDENGKTPTRGTAIRTWKRVRDDVAAARARQEGAKSGQALAPGEVAPGVRAATLPALLPQAPTPTRPLAETGASPAPANALPREGGQPAALSDDELQRVLDDLAQKQGGPRLPLPRIM